METALIREEFEDLGYVLLENFIPKELIQVVCNYTRFTRRDRPKYGNVTMPETHFGSEDCLIESMLHYMIPHMEELTGRKLYPTHGFFRVYKGKDVLHTHKDRPAAEISVTICLGYDENPSMFYANGKYFKMNPGDIVIYKGCEVDHGRPIPFEGFWHSQMFLHYVDRNGKYTSWKYDKETYRYDMFKEIGYE